MKQVDKFRKSVKECYSIVFCVLCGSTYIDQNGNNLECYDCSNRGPFKLSKFGLAREGDEYDVAKQVATNRGEAILEKLKTK